MWSELVKEHADAIVDNPTFWRYIERLEGLYFHGIPMWYVMFQDFFRLFGHYYLHHGLCYQATGLAMLIYRDNPSARIIQGIVKNPEKNIVASHSWLEFYEFGGRWILDMTWVMPIPTPISMGEYQLGNQEIKRCWTCAHKDFWSSPASFGLFEGISNPESSYILPALDIFCPSIKPTSDNTDAKWGFMYGGNHENGDDFDYFSSAFISNAFLKKDSAFVDVGGALVTQSIINAFVTRPERKSLPRKIYRREMRKYQDSLS